MKKLVLLSLIGLVSCVEPKPECTNYKCGKAVLIGYRVAKHSKLYFKNPVNNQKFEIGSVGGRREPNIKLGDTINVQYCNDEMVFDKYKYVEYPENSSTRTIFLDNESYNLDCN